MKHFFLVTGTSSGLGKELALQLLEHEDHEVHGLSRRSPKINHPRYTHHTVDLSQAQALHQWAFPDLQGFATATLINNAGWIGPVRPFAKLDPLDLDRALQVNFQAPFVLTHAFLNSQGPGYSNRTILNISSGAAQYPVPSWSAYCASKAALDRMSEVLALDHPELTVLSVAPGVVDTPMQADIRGRNPIDFPQVERFISYHDQGELVPAGATAERLLKLLKNPEITQGQVVVSLRKLTFNP